MDHIIWTCNLNNLKKLSIDKIRGYVEQKRRDSNISGQSSGVFSSCQGNSDSKTVYFY